LCTGATSIGGLNIPSMGMSEKSRVDRRRTQGIVWPERIKADTSEDICELGKARKSG
jgi:hypothetical protein